MTENVLWETKHSKERSKFSLQFAATLQTDLHRELLEKAELSPKETGSIENLLLSAQKEVTKAWQSKISPLLAEFLQLWSEKLEENQRENYFKKQLTKADFYALMAGMGSNSWWRDQGSADERAICYTNSIEAVGSFGLSSTYQKLLSENTNEVERNELLEIMIMSTTLHELGHTLFKLEDLEISKRVGYYHSYIETIEEIKADTTGIRIFWESEKIKGVTPKAQKYLQFIVGYCHEYIISDSGSEETINAYRKMAEIMLARMINAGGVKFEGEEYIILDMGKSFEAICELSRDVLNNYADETMNPEKMAEYVKSLKS